MSQTNPPAPANPGNGAPQQPPLLINIQYIKDLSFEVPNAPEIFATLRENPRVDLSLDVNARRIQEGENIFEVALQLRADARVPKDNSPAFIAELLYCGIFTLNVPEEMVEPVLLVECPRLLFPFARNILADMTRDGGFPPIMLTPIDFAALWQSRRGQTGAQPAANA
ncbi:MAG: protein-export chaperone SecB [Acetobacteraceae bacterium]|nr:protein-export chaperone SecB [Acetobacteraceae bacterium]MCX7685358.1 protein-export chaperone SecB [Acetobacteraceae bacterium]MDW8397698.1 protein-export chaperone SecB [Acetobacteraceae bacterium]